MLKVLLARTLLVSVLLFCAGLAALASRAGGHVNDCHTARTCPSDAHTYVWSDGAGGLWDCAAAGSADVDVYLDTQAITIGSMTWYCRAPQGPPVVSPGTAPADTGAPSPGQSAPGAPTTDPYGSPAGAASGGQALALGDAKSAVRRMIQRRTGRAARNLRYGCSRVNGSTIACKPSWSDSVYVYAGRTTVKNDDAGAVSASFSGTRARRTCVGRYRTAKLGLRQCSRPVHW